MKAIINILCFTGLAFLGLKSHCSGQQERNFATMTLDQADAVISQTYSGDVLLGFANSALSSKRLDLIELCITNQNSRVYLYIAAKSLENNRLKAQTVVMMLRAGVGFWPPDEYEVGFFPKPTLEEPIKGILTTYFPAEKFGDESIATRASRLALADRLVNLVGAPIKSSSHDSPSPSVLLQGKGQSTPAAHDQIRESSQQTTTPGTQTYVMPSERRALAWPWIVGILALIMITVLLLKPRA